MQKQDLSAEVQELRKLYEHTVEKNKKATEEARALFLENQFNEVYEHFREACRAGEEYLKLGANKSLDEIIIMRFRTIGIKLSTYEARDDNKYWKFEWAN